MLKKIIVKEETNSYLVSPADFSKACDLTQLTSINTPISLCTVSISRPGLLLSGFTDFFAELRVQVLGKAEINFINTLEKEEKLKALNRLFSRKIPCAIIARGQKVPKELIDVAHEHNKPLFSSKKITSVLVNEMVAYLNEALAKRTSVHGVLLDVFGTGVLLQGKSGIGKSETALELIHRGHRLVADDLVDLKCIKQEVFGCSPPLISHLMEIRGVGIIDIRAIYGVGSVIANKKLELIIELELWNDNKTYERVGLVQKTVPILGVEIPRLLVPVMPGRNLAIVIEVAARDYRLKQSGYNAANMLNEKMSLGEVTCENGIDTKLI